ncbi:MAG: sigma-70 family RNA polymerase sigma factor [Crocinitomicaceae bacterium]|nr:sigma-70 family RNA polymerase sigma factor [Crocinitomicaceae bacterium]
MSLASNLKEDRKLIALAKKDYRAFGLIYDKYFERIYLFVFKRVGDKDIAGDICQEAMLKAMHNIRKYEDRGYQFSSWLFRIASNEVNLYFRKSKKNISVSVDEGSVQAILTEAKEDPEDNSRQVKLLQLMSEMPSEKVEIIELRFFSGFSFKEIAEFYGISEANAKMRLYRLLDKLKKSLTK